MMKRNLTLLLVVLLVISCFPIATAKEGIVLTIWNSSQSMLTWYDEVVTPEFIKQHPEVSGVEVLYMPIQDYIKKLAVALPSGDVPDIMEIEDSWAVPYVTGGYFEPNTDELNAILDEMRPEFKNCLSYEGVSYGVPVAPFHEIMYYNLDYLAEAGIEEIPETMDDLIDAAVKMTVRDEDGKIERSGFSMRLGGNPSGTTQKFWVLALLGNGVDIYEESATQPGKFHCGFDNEGGYNALKLYIDLLYKYKVDDFSSMKDTAAFAAGKTAINMREPSSSYSIIENGPDINWVAAPMPMGAVQRATFLITLNLYVPVGGKNVELAREYVKLAASRDMQETQVIRRGGYNPYLDADLKEGHDPRLAPGFEMPEDLKVYTVPVQNSYDTICVRLGEMLPNILQKSELLDNPEGIKEEVKKMADVVNEVYKDFGEYGE
ncbi:MAG TPA: extracellular solute-binding protein [Christensenellaceae bacterium]|nr:extracellular solute-binding protein [Christensenellaceae bacterium]